MNTGNNIKIKECKEVEKWEEDLGNFRFSLFQCKEWIEALTIGTNHIPVFFDLYSNETKAGKISGIIHKTKYFGKQIYFFSGPALKNYNYALYSEFIDSLISYFKAKGVSRIVFGSYGSQYAPEIKHPLCYSFKRKEFIVDLTNDISKRFSRNIRRNITKARSAGFKIKTDRTNIKVLKQLLDATQRFRIKHNREQYDPLPLPLLNYNSLEKLSDTDLTKNYIAISDGHTTGFLLTLVKYPYSEALVTGIDEQFYKTGISPFMYEYAFEELKSNGFISMNLGGVPEGEDGKKLSHFKRSLGAEEKVVYGATTNFLIYPYKVLNPILNLARKMPQNSSIIKFLKKFI